MDDVKYIAETSLTIRGSRRCTTVPKTIEDKFELMGGSIIRWIM
jgi:hypothetical protein